MQSLTMVGDILSHPATSLPGPISVEIRDRRSVIDILPAWRDLHRKAVDANLFLLPDYAAAWLTELSEADGFRLALIWRGEGPDRRLIGLWPFRPGSRRFGLPLPMAESMTRIYAPLSTPLLDPVDGLDAAKALLRLMAAPGTAQGLALFEFMLEDGETAALLRQAMADLGLRYVAMRPRPRAIARPLTDPPGGDYIQATMSAKKRRTLASLAKQLGAEGEVRFDIASGPGEVEAAMEDFLRLEESGWKGAQAGTASLQRADRAAFMRAVARSLAPQGELRIHRLWLGQEVIATGLCLVDGRRAAFWKTSYDERFARFSPGTQIALAVTRDLMGTEGLGFADSLADPDHPLMNHLWRERVTISDWLVDLKPGGSVLWRLAQSLERGRQALRQRRRQLLVALKKRR